MKCVNKATTALLEPECTALTTLVCSYCLPCKRRRQCSNWFQHGSTTISYPQCSLTFLRERYLHRCREQSFAILVLSYMTYKILGHTPSKPTFYFDPAKKTEHNRCDGTSSYSVTALFLESLNTAKRYHIRTQMENVHFIYIIIQD